jgi:hypothetical protein
MLLSIKTGIVSDGHMVYGAGFGGEAGNAWLYHFSSWKIK